VQDSQNTKLQIETPHDEFTCSRNVLESDKKNIPSAPPCASHLKCDEFVENKIILRIRNPLHKKPHGKPRMADLSPSTELPKPKHSVRLSNAAPSPAVLRAVARHPSSECRRYPTAGVRRSTPVHVVIPWLALRSGESLILHLCSRIWIIYICAL
jgi:hypothetical protein